MKYQLIKKIKGVDIGYVASGKELDYFKCGLYPEYWQLYEQESPKYTCKWCNKSIKDISRKVYCSEYCGDKANALNAALNYHKNKNGRD
jgi:hypothetical protein